MIDGKMVKSILNNAKNIYHDEDPYVPSFDDIYEAIEYQTTSLIEIDEIPNEYYDTLVKATCDYYDYGDFTLEIT